MTFADQEEIHQLWDELADYGPDRAPQAVILLMSSLCRLCGAWNATWAGATRLTATTGTDPLQGWRVAAMTALHPIPPLPEDQHFREILRLWDRREIDPSFLLPLREVGSFRSYSFRRELPPSWFSSPFYQLHYGAAGTHDAVFIAFPLNEDCESHFGFYARETFTDEAIALLTAALRGLKWLHRSLCLSHGLLMASTPLTAAERRVLLLLLTDAPEKAIAASLQLAASTTHQYVIGIYRQFGVRSRAGPMRLWLAQGG